jgi:hypothetical protein
MPDSVNLPHFNDSAKCEKCGCKDVKASYAKPGWRGNYETCSSHGEEEHIDRRCSRCNYIWAEKCLDVPGDDAGTLSENDSAALEQFKETMRNEVIPETIEAMCSREDTWCQRTRGLFKEKPCTKKRKIPHLGHYEI